MKARTPSSFPSGIPYIIGNEAAERFSYYGMKAILVVFMTCCLRDLSGHPAPMSEDEAKTYFHAFGAANYLFPLLGALLSDIVLGKYRTILFLSIVYCLGHASLALGDTRLHLALGLSLIAIGAGGIKPCVSAHVGDQFEPHQESARDRSFRWFYLAINIGAFLSMILTPVLLGRFGASTAFAVPGILMFVATVIFRAGHSRFIALPPVGLANFRSAFREAWRSGRLQRLLVIYLFIAVFWSLYEQTGSSWVLQAERLDRHLSLRFFGHPLELDVLAAQIQSLNPVLILLIVPLVSRRLTKHPIPVEQRIGRGLWLAALSFAIVAGIEYALLDGAVPSMWWQVLALTAMTLAEVLVSVTGLELSYAQSRHELRSFTMGLFFLSVSLGNALAALVNELMTLGVFALSGVAYYGFFVVLMAGAAAIYPRVVRPRA